MARGGGQGLRPVQKTAQGLVGQIRHVGVHIHRGYAPQLALQLAQLAHPLFISGGVGRYQLQLRVVGVDGGVVQGGAGGAMGDDDANILHGATFLSVPFGQVNCTTICGKSQGGFVRMLDV